MRRVSQRPLGFEGLIPGTDFGQFSGMETVGNGGFHRVSLGYGDFIYFMAVADF